MSSPSPDGGVGAAPWVVAIVACLGVVSAIAIPASAPVVAVAAAVAAAVYAVRRGHDRARIRRLRRVAAAFAAGDLAARADVAGVDSIATLAAELNALGDRLGAAGTALEVQRRLLDGALGSLAEGVACIDDLDRILYANPAWRHLAAGGTDAPGSAFYEHIPAAAVSAAVAKVRGSGRADEVEFEHRRHRLRATVSRATPEALVIVLHDLTELKRLEGARREFVAAVSHELKTPLTAVAGFAETLLDGALDGDLSVARGFVEKIARHADRLTILVRDVLTLSRLEQGSWEVRPEPIDLVEIGRQLADEHQPAAADRQVRIVLEAPSRLDAISDRELLQQLLGNLVSNAIRYNRPGGTVIIRMSDGGERVRLQVTDTGIGIPPEHRERVFERFFRVDAHRSRASGGTGLGLAIVKQLVDALQGTISLESGSGGTTFTVECPRTDPRSVSPRR